MNKMNSLKPTFKCNKVKRQKVGKITKLFSYLLRVTNIYVKNLFILIACYQIKYYNIFVKNKNFQKSKKNNNLFNICVSVKMRQLN